MLRRLTGRGKDDPTAELWTPAPEPAPARTPELVPQPQPAAPPQPTPQPAPESALAPASNIMDVEAARIGLGSQRLFDKVLSKFYDTGEPYIDEVCVLFPASRHCYLDYESYD